MTRAGARWGCFLPDLTRLASGSSTTNLPASISAIALPIARKTGATAEMAGKGMTAHPKEGLQAPGLHSSFRVSLPGEESNANGQPAAP